MANWRITTCAFSRADMYRTLGRTAEARSSYEKALELTQQEPKRRFLAERLEELNKKLAADRSLIFLGKTGRFVCPSFSALQ